MDRGQLDLDAPVADYWPEFAANGKEGVLVNHFLTHSSGVPAFSHRIGTDILYDWEAACADLAGQAPWWEPGSQSGYHAISQGFLIGQLVRRISGKSIGAFFREEVANKVGSDFHIGVDSADFDRLADSLQDPSPVELDEVNDFIDTDPDSIQWRVLDGLDITEETMSEAGWRQAEIPAANGHGNARSVVRAQTAIANGGSAFGVELLSPETCGFAFEPLLEGHDLVMGMPMSYCKGGYARKNPTLVQFGSDDGTIFWGGAGGSSIVIDRDVHVCAAYAMNQMSNNILGDKRANNLGQAFYKGL